MPALLGLEPRDAGREPVEPVVLFDDGVRLERARLRCAGQPGPTAADPAPRATGR
ncbi:hypothetical protein ACFFWC_10005 [Plantactinospora siamensis]|uniref:Uncharacterized protein n=1 Tax=Plantactinospora siamensis TaxID=555372 RepID=A0ABV6P4W9_9ACTN